MKTAVVTLSTGTEILKVKEVSEKYIINYANKIEADYVNISESKYRSCWGKLEMYNIIDNYDRILYVDCDVLIKNNCPNIFNVVPENMIGMVDESYVTTPIHIRNYAERTRYGKINFIPKKYYNAGMIVFSKEHKNLFLDRKNLVDHYIDQTYLNMNIILNNYNCEDLGYKFNFYRAFDRTYTKDHNFMYRKRTVENFKKHYNLKNNDLFESAYMIHYAGDWYGKDKENFMKQDLETYKEMFEF